MDIHQALVFLEENQPMPSDYQITQEQCDAFISCLKLFMKYPERRCVTLLINSVSDKTGLGMYEMISDVLMAQDRNAVMNSIKLALINGSNAVKYRCCWWAIDINAWNLLTEVRPLIYSKNSDLSDAAKAYIELRQEYV